jgi:hypothetical protein
MHSSSPPTSYFPFCPIIPLVVADMCLCPTPYFARPAELRPAAAPAQCVLVVLLLGGQHPTAADLQPRGAGDSTRSSSKAAAGEPGGPSVFSSRGPGQWGKCFSGVVVPRMHMCLISNATCGYLLSTIPC